MKIITALWFVTALVVVRADEFCPNHCQCTDEGSSGFSAICTKLDPREQVFQNIVQHLTVVNTANKSFTLSDNIFDRMGLQKLQSIKIVNSSLADISVKAFHKLTSLFDVNLSDNQLFLIHPDTFVNNTNLHRLKLSGNPLQLTQLLQSPLESLLRSSTISDLDLSRCQLTQILPKTFSQLKNLIFISLSHNYLKTIPNNVFDELEYLEELDLSYNVISKVDRNAFKMNKEISVLKLRGNPIEVLNGIDAGTMEELDLSSCNLRILMKESIDGMPDLMTLNLSSNNIEVISSDAFTGLSELKSLDMSNNKLIGPLPRNLFDKNCDLETVILSGNQDLGALVDETGFDGNHLPMARLELAYCGLTDITDNQLKGFRNLNVLDLSGNAIRRLDSSTFALLNQLNTLDLSNNRLVTLSSQLFANNNALVKLVLSGNPLTYLSPATFHPLVNLKYLYANNCSMQHLWDGPKHNSRLSVDHKENLLPSLAVFDISDNHFTTLHLDDFDSFEHLETIGLAGNPLACDKSTFQVINFFDKNRVDPHHNELTLNAAAGDAQVAGLQWNELVDRICPVKLSKNTIVDIKVVEKDAAKVVDSEGVRVDSSSRVNAINHEQQPLPALIPALQKTPNTLMFTRDEILVETNESSIMWPMVLTLSILLVALYFIIYTVTEITHRRRTIPAAYARAASLGGHVRTRGNSGSPMYYKLYEECSIPAKPNNEKKNYILDFSPIHTILKKNSYKVMRNNGEANV